jgi:hypothetical protein
MTPSFICATAGPKSRSSEIPPSNRLFSIPCFIIMHIRVGQISIADQHDLTFLATIGPLSTHSRHHLWTLTDARESPHISFGLVVPLEVPSASHRLIKIVGLPPMFYLTSTRGLPSFRSSYQRFATDVKLSCSSIVELPGQPPVFESVRSRPLT